MMDFSDSNFGDSWKKTTIWYTLREMLGQKIT